MKVTWGRTGAGRQGRRGERRQRGSRERPLLGEEPSSDRTAKVLTFLEDPIHRKAQQRVLKEKQQQLPHRPQAQPEPGL